MEIMETKIVKERRNAANRAANCDNANIDKVVGAAEGQLRDIRTLMGQQGITALPEDLRELAELRLANPEASLRELGVKLGLSRSGVNHRMQKLARLADKLREMDGPED